MSGRLFAAAWLERLLAGKGNVWERIGAAECPILYRRTLLSARHCKVMLHRFVPFAGSEDCHDHPRPFLTFVLRGGYDDVQPDGTRDRVRAPTVRYRPAKHAHVTLVHPDGALTLVVMGPLVRVWGFWRDGRWWPFRDYEARYGIDFRCEGK